MLPEIFPAFAKVEIGVGTIAFVDAEAGTSAGDFLEMLEEGYTDTEL